ncbi:hypothetical protein GE09DRAFT_1106094 [Coniochaeta sp. 2T2.1]|nr:hypothetical protein GE09DRAFT_1106094 [Coniochaeta sp. 2T2.1]
MLPARGTGFDSQLLHTFLFVLSCLIVLLLFLIAWTICTSVAPVCCSALVLAWGGNWILFVRRSKPGAISRVSLSGQVLRLRLRWYSMGWYLAANGPQP